jgi:hypothetical protein
MLRPMYSHLRLKYSMDGQRRSLLATLLLKTYKHASISIADKVELLNGILILVGKKKNLAYDFVLDWQCLWDEAYGLFTREKKTGPIGSDVLVSKLASIIIKLLYCTRYLVSAEDADAVVATAMARLRDERDVKFVEGLLLLNNILPTAYAKYDDHVAEWMKIWLSKPHNAHWDVAWLTMLCRARKHTTKYDWSALSSTLMIKAKEQMDLPGIGGRSSINFFPNYYVSLLYKKSSDCRACALNKIAKLMYFVSYNGPMVTAGPVAVLPPKIPLASELELPGLNAAVEVYEGAHDLWLFLQSLRVFFYPSHSGGWTNRLAMFISPLVSDMCKHTGAGVLAAVHGKDVFTKVSISNSRPIHEGTTRYLTGCLLSLVMEGLYGRNGYMFNCCMICLINLITIDANVGRVALPVLIEALGTGSINQAHQAPAAISSIAWSFKQLLYPRPVILPHLNELLTLSLMGIDSNDEKKSRVTLNMYANILQLIPLLDDYSLSATAAARPINESFLQIATSSKSNSAETWAEYAPYLAALGGQIEEWVLVALDRTLDLMEKYEEPKEGQPRRQLSQELEGFLGIMFECCRSAKLREQLEDKVLSFATKVKPNAGKEFSKLMNGLVRSNPSAFGNVLAVLADPEMLAGEWSKEKMAFRLHMLAGAAKNAGDELLVHLPVLEKLIAFSVQSSEKEVRKQACRLLKDTLRGLSAFYEDDLIPDYNPDKGLFLGATKQHSELQVNWRTPSQAALEATVGLLRRYANGSLDAAAAIVSKSSKSMAVDSMDEEKLSFKMAEEKMVTHLEVVRASLRGAAEVLGNGALTSGDDDDEDCMLDTGKSILSSLMSDDQAYLTNFRTRVLTFVSDCNDTIDASDCPADLLPMQDSFLVRKTLLKLVSTVINRRMATMKEPSRCLKNNKSTKLSWRSTITTSMLEWTKRLGPVEGADRAHLDEPLFGTTTRGMLSNVDTWKSYDLDLGNFQGRVKAQHALRLREYAFASTRAVLREDSTRDLYMKVLQQVVGLAGHEYATIRKKASGIFASISGRYGWRLNTVLTDMISKVNTPGSSYPAASGAIALLSQERIMKRITSRWDLCGALLGAILNSQAMLAAVPEADKRQLLMTMVGRMFVMYTLHFHHSPKADAKDEAMLPAAIQRSTLGAIGISSDEWSLAQAPKQLAGGGGLRYDAFAAYTVLHLIGHSAANRIATPGEWGWAIAFATKAHGEPTQVLALAGLVKLAFGAFEFGTDAETLAQLSASLGASAASAPAMWKSLLVSVGHHGHPRGSAPQWSDSIAQFMRSAMYISGVLPRASTVPAHGGPMFSRLPKLEFMATFTALAALASGSVTGREVSVDVIKLVLEAAQDLPSTNEDELRANNTVQAELFGGLCRAVGVLPSGPLQFEAETLVADFFFEKLGKVSITYAADWHEALAYGLAGMTNTVDTPICAGVLDRLHKQAAASKVSAQASSTGGDKESENEEGFATEVKVLNSVTAMLYADMYSSVSSSDPMVMSGVAEAVLGVFADPNCFLLASAFRSSRAVVANVIGRLAFASNGAVDMMPIVARLEEIAASEVPSAVEVEAAPAAETEGTLKASPGKRAMEMAGLFMSSIVTYDVPMWRIETIAPRLLKIILAATGHADLAFAKDSKARCLIFVSRVNSSCTPDLVRSLFGVMAEMAVHPSWHVRFVSVLCADNIYAYNQSMLSVDEKKQVRDIFNGAFHDAHPDVQEKGQNGMVDYLVGKPLAEVEKLAAAYEKNCNIFADRERKKKKAAGESGVLVPPDKSHVTTVMMASSIVRTYPYDLPAFVPGLLVALIRHSTNSQLKKTVVMTVQDFKRTHQDRWSEFKEKFSSTQLEDLQGTGAGTYFS